MARSYRGKDVDMVSLAKKHEKTIALGNAHMNARGDILGKGGKVVKTREEQLKEYYEGNRMTETTVNLKDSESTREVESELKQISEEDLRRPARAKPTKKPVYEDITEAEKEELGSIAKGE